ncbi:MAG: flagellar biosynthetic protein FliO [Hyphomicrobiaceae bacterium]|nr:flagellar biosynthetic protein FliO [Hyphomicrobiaceae bacterium]MCC0024804.1 flagellar biosynthetic protein FliO [Hyphomicrobiaceae bacterium]
MGFLTSLFGGDGLSIWSVGLSLIIVLLLIVAAVWLLKVLFNATGRIGRNNNKRLAVIDSISVDSKRNLVLIRRDQVEHLLLIGGSQDITVETGIPADYAPSASSEHHQQRESSTPERRTAAAASRLGLTGLLRRYNLPGGQNQEAPAPAPATQNASQNPPARPRFVMRPAPAANTTSPEQAPANTPEALAKPMSPLDRLKALGMHRDENTPSPLRRMGLLQPKAVVDTQSGPVSVNGQPEAQKTPDPTADSDNMQPDQHDRDAMASVEEQQPEQHGPVEQNHPSDEQDETRSQNA